MLFRTTLFVAMLGTLPLSEPVATHAVSYKPLSAPPRQEPKTQIFDPIERRRPAAPYMGLDTVHVFAANYLQGWYPTNSMIVVNDSILYGTTGFGGNDGDFDVGVLYKVVNSGDRYSPSSTFSVVHDFYDSNVPNDGGYCTGRLAKDNSGYIYGTCWGGGAYDQGVVYKFNTSNNAMTILYSFGATSDDGWAPEGGVVRDPSTGNLYGVTSYGDGTAQYGTIWKLAPSGGGYSYTKLYEFTAYPDGETPVSITLGSDGNLYGTTLYGGYPYTNGVIWRYDLTYDTFTNLAYTPVDGWHNGLTQIPTAYTSSGRLEFWGVSTAGGLNTCGSDTCGTIYRLSETYTGSGSFNYTVMHNFDDGTNEGYWPHGNLVFTDVFGSAKLYGVLSYGGISGSGSFFRIDLSGSFWEIPSSAGAWTGTNPKDSPWGLVEGKMGTDPVLFGSSVWGGLNGNGWLWFIYQF